MMNLLAMTLPLAFEAPQWLWLLALLPVVIAVSIRTLNALEPLRRAAAIGLRCLVIAALAVCLAEVQYVKSSDKLTVFFLMDRSDSVKGLQPVQEEYLHAVCEKIPEPDDRVAMIDFARNAFIQQLPMTGGYFIQPGRLPEMDHRDRTDVAAAMRLAMAMFPHDSAKRIVLLSDGNENMGDILTEAAAAQAEGVVVDVVPLWYEHGNEVYFDRMVAPTHVEDGDLVPLRMLLHSERATSGRIDIYRNGRLIEMPEDYARVKIQAGNNPFIVRIPVHGGGPQRFEARFAADRPERDDGIEENNVATAFSFVSGKSKALVMTTSPQDDQALVDALRSENICVELRDVAERDVDQRAIDRRPQHDVHAGAGVFAARQVQRDARVVRRDARGGVGELDAPRQHRDGPLDVVRLVAQRRPRLDDQFVAADGLRFEQHLGDALAVHLDLAGLVVALRTGGRSERD